MVKKILILALLVVLFSCKDEDLPIPTTIKALTSTSQTGIAGESSDPLVVQILDQAGAPMPNMDVRFEVISGQASLSSATATTDANGAAFSYVIFGKSKDRIVVQATCPEIMEAVTFTYRMSLSRASKITIVSGNNQEGIGGKLLKDEIVVSVADDYDDKAAGVSVKFVVTEGNGILSETSSITDDIGRARTKFTLSSNTLGNTIVVMTDGDTITLSARSFLPSQLSPLTKVNNGIHLEWEKSPNPGFNSYSLQRTTSQFFPTFIEIATINDITATSFDDNTVNPGTQYQYRVVVRVRTSTEIISDTRTIEAGDLRALPGTSGGIAIDNIRNRIYVSVTNRNEIQVFDLISYQMLEAIYVGSMPMGISLSHDNSTLLVALSGSGDLAFLNLETKEIRAVDVEDALGFPTVYSVIEAGPGEVFAAANPNDRGEAYLVRILTNDNYSVQRCEAFTTRGESTLQADYGNRLFFLSSGRLSVIDPTSLANLGFNGSTSANRFVYSPTTNELYTPGAVLSLSPLAVKRSFQSRIGVGISPDESLIHYIEDVDNISNGSTIVSQDISSGITVTEIPGPNGLEFVLQVLVSEDNKHMVILCIINGGSYRVLFVTRPTT